MNNDFSNQFKTILEVGRKVAQEYNASVITCEHFLLGVVTTNNTVSSLLRKINIPVDQMVDEIKSSFDTLLREYPSGMRVNSLLAGKYFGVKQEFIAVGNGAAELIKSELQTI